MADEALRKQATLRFSRLRGRRVVDPRGTSVGFVLDVIVRPEGGEMVVTQLVLVKRRFALVLSRFGPRVGAFAVDASGIRRPDAGILQMEAPS